jgi:RES domain-containing protein
MAVWYRAHKLKTVSYVFSGDGGLFAAGRWNSLGRKVVYCSASLALATVEWLTHNGLSVSGFTYHRFSIEIPDELVRFFTIDQLPSGWDTEPATNVSREFAEQNLYGNANNSLALAVPSVVIPEELNLIINPLHAHYSIAQKTIKSLGQFKAPVRPEP